MAHGGTEIGNGKRTVLFVCEYNSCRSQLAEALARAVFPAEWRVLSAGLTRTVVSQDVLETLQEVGIEAGDLVSKGLSEVRDHWIDDAVILAGSAVDAVRQAFPDACLHEWFMDDPQRAPGGPEQVRAAVRGAREELRRKLRRWVQNDGSGGQP
jgi:arsenate reductase